MVVDSKWTLIHMSFTKRFRLVFIGTVTTIGLAFLNITEGEVTPGHSRQVHTASPAVHPPVDPPPGLLPAAIPGSLRASSCPIDDEWFVPWATLL
ncbi:hypothetical protein DIPPA_54429, partial [Diplonema papillatum]